MEQLVRTLIYEGATNRTRHSKASIRKVVNSAATKHALSARLCTSCAHFSMNKSHPSLLPRSTYPDTLNGFWGYTDRRSTHQCHPTCTNLPKSRPEPANDVQFFAVSQTASNHLSLSNQKVDQARTRDTGVWFLMDNLPTALVCLIGKAGLWATFVAEGNRDE